MSRSSVFINDVAIPTYDRPVDIMHFLVFISSTSTSKMQAGGVGVPEKSYFTIRRQTFILHHQIINAIIVTLRRERECQNTSMNHHSPRNRPIQALKHTSLPLHREELFNIRNMTGCNVENIFNRCLDTFLSIIPDGPGYTAYSNSIIDMSTYVNAPSPLASRSAW